MRLFKRILSDHAYIPIKMALILYFILWSYYTYNEMNFDYENKAALVFGVLIAYTFIRVLAEFISFNGKSNITDVYFINEQVNNKIKNFSRKFIIHEDGVYEKEWKLQDNGLFEQEEVPVANPIELYYSLLSYLSILRTIGSYSSMELNDKLELLLEAVKKNLNDNNNNDQMYVLKD